MSKSNFFSGQPIFTQLLQLIPKDVVVRLVDKHQTDRYYKKFKTYDHLVSMLYSVFFRCNSLRELCTGMHACEQKLLHLGIKHPPKRSTIAEANSKRCEAFFSDLYQALYRQYYSGLPDSRTVEGRLFMIDSTTIKLFSDIMKGAGSKPMSGKHKGGAKAHVLMKADENIPQMINITHAANNDRTFLKYLSLPANSIAVFDMGYNNYHQFKAWDEQQVTWITRMIPTAWVEEVSVNPLNEEQCNAGVLEDHNVKLGRPSNKPTTKLSVRRIRFYDTESKRKFTFITNSKEFDAKVIADIYKRRWQIEQFFKRIKQHAPLRYFLGDSEHAIRIQIWCAFIADLLIKIVKDRVTKKKWAFSNIASMVRQHLMTYIDILYFLNYPDKAFLPTQNSNDKQLKLNLSG